MIIYTAFVIFAALNTAICSVHRTCGVQDKPFEEANALERTTQTYIREREGRHGQTNDMKAGSRAIPVYWHEIRTSGGDGIIPSSVIDEQMEILNNAYAPRGWSFQINQTTFSINNNWYDVLYGSRDERDMKAALRAGGAADLNIYSTGTQYALGWATFPSEYATNPTGDGIIINHYTLPTGGDDEDFESYNKGTTLIHEVGHWMGLYHTFQGGCGLPGDFVSDTPEVKRPNYGCPGDVDSCPYDGLGNDMTWNFMDYVDDECMNAFTDGQWERMETMFQIYRCACSLPPIVENSGDDNDRQVSITIIIIIVPAVVFALVIGGGVAFYFSQKSSSAAIIAPNL